MNIIPKLFSDKLVILFILMSLFCFDLKAQENNVTIESLLKEYKENLPDTSKLRIYRHLSIKYTGVDYDKKKEIAIKYREIAKKVKNDTLEIEATIDIGLSYALKRINDSAFYYFTEANERAKELKYYRGAGRSSVNIGFLYEQVDNSKAAIDRYMEAIYYFKKKNYKRGQAQCYMNIGGIYYDNGLNEMAEYYFKQSHQLYSDINYDIGIAASYYSFGNIYRRFGDYEKANSYFIKSLEIREKNNDLSGIALSNWGLGKVYLDAKEYQKAIEKCSIAYEIHEKTDNLFNKSAVLNTLAVIYSEMKDFNNAYKAAEESLEIGRKLNIKKIRLQAYRVLASIATDDKNYKKATEYNNKYIDLNDSVTTESVTQHIFLSELNRVKNEADVLQKDNELISSKISEYFKIIIIISILLIVVVIMTMMLMKRNSEKNEINKLLTKQKDEIAFTNEKIVLVNEKLQKQMQISEKQNKELEQLNKVKNKFFSIISHDMRGPLANLNMLIDLYRSDQLSKEELDELLSKIDKTIYETRSFLDNLLEWSKNQLDGMQVNPEKFDLYEIIEKNLKLIGFQITSKGIHLENIIKPETYVFADPNMMEVVVRNLISNSVKFCKENDSITLKAQEYEHYVEFIISDTGTGISEKDCKRIFELTNSKSVGTFGEIGHQIGLILCKSMLDQNNGTIRVESTLEVGTTFYISIPK